MRACYAEARNARRWAPNLTLLSVDEPMVVDGTSAVVDRDQLERAFGRLSMNHRTGVVLHHYLDLPLEPITLVKPAYQVLALAVRGPTFRGLRTLLTRLRRDGARLLVVSDDPKMRRTGKAAIALDPTVPEWLSPIVGIVPCQLFAYHLALSRGLDPDSPRGLQKVTLTQ